MRKALVNLADMAEKTEIQQGIDIYISAQKPSNRGTRHKSGVEKWYEKRDMVRKIVPKRVQRAAGTVVTEQVCVGILRKRNKGNPC